MFKNNKRILKILGVSLILILCLGEGIALGFAQEKMKQQNAAYLTVGYMAGYIIAGCEALPKDEQECIFARNQLRETMKKNGYVYQLGEVSVNDQ